MNFLNLKYSYFFPFRRPLDSVARGGQPTRSPPLLPTPRLQNRHLRNLCWCVCVWGFRSLGVWRRVWLPTVDNHTHSRRGVIAQKTWNLSSVAVRTWSLAQICVSHSMSECRRRHVRSSVRMRNDHNEDKSVECLCFPDASSFCVYVAYRYLHLLQMQICLCMADWTTNIRPHDDWHFFSCIPMNWRPG